LIFFYLYDMCSVAYHYLQLFFYFCDMCLCLSKLFFTEEIIITVWGAVSALLRPKSTWKLFFTEEITEEFIISPFGVL
jgi:hypothetical protein